MALLFNVALESTQHVSGIAPSVFFVCYSWESTELCCDQSVYSYSEQCNHETLTIICVYDVLDVPCMVSSERHGCGAYHILDVLPYRSCVADENVTFETQPFVDDQDVAFETQPFLNVIDVGAEASPFLDVVEDETVENEVLEVLSSEYPTDQLVAFEVQRPFLADAPKAEVFYHPKQPPGLVQLVKNTISFEVSERVNTLLKLVRSGLDAGHAPELAVEGSGGVYFMKDECGVRNVAVFKPIDEEAMAVNNPRGYSSSYMGKEGLKKGTQAGGGALREVAAYVLDHPSSGRRCKLEKDWEEGFAGVPTTVLVRCYHEAFTYMCVHEYDKAKLGSLQEFVHALTSCEDIGTAHFSVEEVHKITVLDLRLANTDRHAGNILLCRGKDGALKLVPLDHGYCLPEKFDDCTFEWLYWPQASQPYGRSALKYIEALDAEEDIKLLQQCGWAMKPACMLVLRIATMLLKKGAAAGLTPSQIGCIMSCSKATDNKPPIEALLEQAEALKCASSTDLDLHIIATLLDELILKVKGVYV